MEVTAVKHLGAAGLRGSTPLLRLQSDDRLVALTRRGNQGAYEALVARYQSRLLAFCRHMLGSREDAEDVLQEVFAAAFNAMLADDRAINVRPWLYRIARNRSLNHLRKQTAIGVDSMDIHLAEHGSTTADKVDGREKLRELVADVQSLAETQRTALLLREMDNLSYEQIAEAMETTVPSVKSLLVRARVSLAEASEARLLSCEDVRMELGEWAEGLCQVSPPVRRHIRDCRRCATFQKQLRKTNRALAAVFPIGPLLLVKKLLVLHWAHGAAASAGAGGAAGGAAAAGGSATVGGATAGGVLSAGLGAVATKTAAGIAAVAIVGAVEVDHAKHQRMHHRATPVPAHVVSVGPPVAPPVPMVLSSSAQPAPAPNAQTASGDETAKAKDAAPSVTSTTAAPTAPQVTYDTAVLPQPPTVEMLPTAVAPPALTEPAPEPALATVPAASTEQPQDTGAAGQQDHGDAPAPAAEQTSPPEEQTPREHGSPGSSSTTTPTTSSTTPESTTSTPTSTAPSTSTAPPTSTVPSTTTPTTTSTTPSSSTSTTTSTAPAGTTSTPAPASPSEAPASPPATGAATGAAAGSAT